MRRLVIADIHGGFKALQEVLKKCEADYENDKLICLGDTCDGWPEIEQCFDELLKFKNLVYIIGNHDEWTREYYMTGVEPMGWYSQGGKPTIDAFGKQPPFEIMNILNTAKSYHIEDNMIFVHGGFDPYLEIEKHHRTFLIWDRDLISIADHKIAMHEKHGHPAKISIYDKIFVGHTPTLIYDKSEPIINCELRMIDTGACYSGPLTIMDIDTDEFWQSKPVHLYYPGIKSRGHYGSNKLY